MTIYRQIFGFYTEDLGLDFFKFAGTKKDIANTADRKIRYRGTSPPRKDELRNEYLVCIYSTSFSDLYNDFKDYYSYFYYLV